MATDFRFNGQQSYSPLLAALAQAPADRAKLAILQEQNNRERLSSLLTNMSNAASLGRAFQQQQAINEQKRLMSQQSPLAGAAAGVAPEAAASGVLGVTSPFMGLDAMMSQQPPLAQKPQVPSFNDVSNTAPSPQPGPSGGPTMQGTPGTIQGDPRKSIIMNKLFPGQYEVSTNPTTGNRELVSKIPGLPAIPLDNMGTPMQTGEVQPGQALNPKQKEETLQTRNYLVSRNDSLATEIKPLQDQIKAAQQLSTLTKANIPAAGLSVITEILRAGGLNRISQYEVSAGGKDKSAIEMAKQTANGLLDGTLTNVNREQIQALSKVMRDSALFNIDNVKNAYVEQSMQESPELGRDRFEKSYSAVAKRYSNGLYDPGTYQKGKGLVQASVPKVGAVEGGYRFKGGDPGDQKSWVKQK